MSPTPAIYREQSAEYDALDPSTKAMAAAHGTRMLSGTKKSPMVDVLANSKVEAWRVNAYIPANRKPLRLQRLAQQGKPATADVEPKSGVTVGNGVDFGQWSADRFIDAGIEPYLVDKIERYGLFGVTGDAAFAQLDKVSAQNGSSFLFSDGEVTLMSNVITEVSQNELRTRLKPGQYDSFNDDQKNTVMSLAHLYGFGSKGLQTHPNAWRQINNEDWEGLYHNLKDYGDPGSHERNSYVARWLAPTVSAGRVAGLFDNSKDSGLSAGEFTALSNVKLTAPKELLS